MFPSRGHPRSSSGVSTTSVERKDTGINLKIKPQISEGEYIRMDISQEISAVKNSKGQAIDLVTTKRSAKTSIVVKDKETVVIGGLIQDQEQETSARCRFWGISPAWAGCSRPRARCATKTNLMILLTPHIVKDAADLAQVSGDQRVKFGESAKKIEPVDVQKEITGK